MAKQKNTLPNSLTKVTWFSKGLALLLFLAFLGVAFFAGFKLRESMIGISFTPSPTPTASMCTKDSDCILAPEDPQNSCCPNTKCLRLADDGVIAVNSSSYAAQKTASCGAKYMCPMIMAVCTKGISEENAHYSAKCIQHICQKVYIASK